MQVEQIFRCPQTGAAPSASVWELAYLLWNQSCVPICEGPRLVGVVTPHSLAVHLAQAEDLGRATAKGCMEPVPATIALEASLEDAARAMIEHGTRLLAVEADGRPPTVISVRDLCGMAPDLAAEVLRETPSWGAPAAVADRLVREMFSQPAR